MLDVLDSGWGWWRSRRKEEDRDWGGARPGNKKLDKIFYSGRHDTHKQNWKGSFVYHPLNYPYFHAKFSI